jgi:methyl-accepting chemotaxis protein
MTPTALPVPLSTQVRRGRDGVWGSLFRAHGVWAPGVRLFRALGFAQKALCISLVFMCPIALLSWSFVGMAQTSLASSARERVGVAYQKEVLAALRLALEHQSVAVQTGFRSSVTSMLDEVRQRAAAQWDRLSETDKALGADLGTAEAFKALREAAVSLARAEGMAHAIHLQHADFIEALLDLAGQVTDSSGLTLDPEIASSYLIDASVVHGLDLLAQLGRLRRVGTDAMVAGTVTPTQAHQLIRGQPLAARRLGEIKAAIAKIEIAAPAVANALGHPQAVNSVEAFLAKIDGAPLAEGGPKGDAVEFAELGRRAIDQTGAMLARALDQLDLLLAARMHSNETQRNLILAALIAALFVAVYLFRSFYLVLSGGMREVSRHMTAIKQGDLTTYPNPRGHDEMARLMRTVHDLQQSLRGIVSKVRDSANAVATSSTEVSSGASDLSTRTEQAATSLQQSAAAMEQLGATVRQTAGNAECAAKLASANAQVAERGGLVIGRVGATMLEIQASSRSIGEIIGTIDSIAFQTNILALNAAVEAARAGMQGRGFAVVAAEVRALAQRSALAARKIKTLVTESVEKVAAGAGAVQSAGQTMQELVANARQMNALVAEISSAASEQSAGISQVALAVQDMDQMTQQNAALVEETTAAALSLQEQAGQLTAEVGRFKLPARAVF